MIGVVLSNFSMTLLVLAPAIGFMIPLFFVIIPDWRRAREEKKKPNVDYETITLNADGILMCKHDR